MIYKELKVYPNEFNPTIMNRVSIKGLAHTEEELKRLVDEICHLYNYTPKNISKEN